MTCLFGMTMLVFRPPLVMNLDQAKAQGWLNRYWERRGDDRESGLWAYIDVQGQALAFRLALESDLTGHHLFYTMADDLSANTTVAALTERHFPLRLPHLDRLTGKTFFDLTPAREQLAFASGRTWRKTREAG